MAGARRARAHVRLRGHRVGKVTGTSFAVWAPNARGVRVIGDFNHWDGPRPPDALTRLGRGLGTVRARRRRRHAATSSTSAAPTGGGGARPTRWPSATEHPPATASVVYTSGYDWEDEDWLAARGPRRADRRADQRSTRCTSAPGGRACPTANSPSELIDVRHQDRLHPRGVPAGGRAPVRRLLGLPGHVLLRPDRPVRQPGRLPLPRRPAAPGRHRRDPRLGARALPQGRLGAGPLRRHPALRARRPAARRAARLGHAASSTSAAARCATSWSPTRCTGWRTSTSTGCGSTPSPRCSTSTTRARPGQWTPNEHGGRENLDAVAFLQEVNATVLQAGARGR